MAVDIFPKKIWQWVLMGALVVLATALAPAWTPAEDLVVDNQTYTVEKDIWFDNEYIGQHQTGTLEQKGHTNNVFDRLILGENPGASGTYNLHDGTLYISNGYGGYEYIGNSGIGTFNQSGGTNSFNWGSLYLGLHSGASGTYNLSNGTLDVSLDEHIGHSGSGTFTQTGGLNSVTNGCLYLGYGGGASGTYNLSGTGRIEGDSEYIGYSGNGTFTQSGGTNQGDWLTLGYNSQSSGTYILNGGSVGMDSVFIGSNGTGAFMHTGGTHQVYLDMMSIGEEGGSGIYTLGDGTSSPVLMATQIYIGDGGSGTFIHQSGTNKMITGSDLYLFVGADGHGAYTLGDGASTPVLMATEEFLGFPYYGDGGSGTFTHKSGTNVTGTLTLADSYYTCSGTYNLENGSLKAGTINLNTGGFFNQTGGTLDFTTCNQSGGTGAFTDLFLGKDAGHHSSYTLRGGSLNAANESVGSSGSGDFTQEGGIHIVGGDLKLGINQPASGTYKLKKGSLSAANEFIGLDGSGTFTQEDGTNSVTGDLVLGRYITSSGTYNQKGGNLLASNEYIGHIGNGGIGSFIQSGGTNEADALYLDGSDGTYDLSGNGNLLVSNEVVGKSGIGTFTQTGGTHTITNSLVLADQPGSSGTYNLEGGTLSAGSMEIKAGGTFELNNDAAQVNISQSLTFGENAQFSAVPGATINMTGSNFYNYCTDPENLSGLANLKLVFTGGPVTEDYFEVAGQDLGPVMAGFTHNFALGTLQLGDDTHTGYLGLYDATDNSLGGGDEALYVYTLILGLGSTLDLHELHLYCLSFTDLGGTVLNGSIQVVPLPASILLLGSGLLGLGLLGYRRKRS
ncbi:MAG: hypothetical protein P8X65_11855 [Syntrophobacterales bacterium]|jgi:fibronectin-binding autotransporter adhesin